MKKIICTAIVLAAIPVARAQFYRAFNYKLDAPFTVTQTFRVRGVCEICKRTIEGAVKKSPGIYMADWDAGSQLLVVKYNRSNVTADKIEQLVVETGHDTHHIKASAKAYAALPACCKYERNLK